MSLAGLDGGAPARGQREGEAPSGRRGHQHRPAADDLRARAALEINGYLLLELPSCWRRST
jgi:hypothetical protein